MQARILGKTYPVLREPREKLRVIAGICFFVFLFLVIFQPLRIYELPEYQKVLVILGYIGVISSVLLFNFFILPELVPGFFAVKEWRVYKEIFWNNWNIGTSGVMVLFYTYYLGFASISFLNLIKFQILVFSIGIFPVTLFVSYNSIILHRKYNMEQKKINSRIIARRKTIGYLLLANRILTIDYRTFSLRSNLHDFLGVVSNGQYSRIYWIEEGRLKKEVWPLNIFELEMRLKKFDERIKRCHPNYLVNLNKVLSVNISSRGCFLRLDGCQKVIPVSTLLGEKIKKELLRL